MAEKMSESEKKKEDWMNSKWRPMMGWMYMGVCIFDFVLAPVLWSLTQALFHGGVNVQWQPLTLQGAGLFHISMGAVLGLAAYGRTQEKLAGANNGGIAPPTSGTTYTPPAPIQPLHPPALAHQAEAALEAHLSVHQQQALVAIQDLEHQRVQMWSQDSGENPPR